MVALSDRIAVLLTDDQVSGSAVFLAQVIIPYHVALVVADNQLTLESQDPDPVRLEVRRAGGVGESARKEAARGARQSRALFRLPRLPWQRVAGDAVKRLVGQVDVVGGIEADHSAGPAHVERFEVVEPGRAVHAVRPAVAD